MNRRVVITGMGTINPLGDSLEGYYRNLLAGRSGVKRWQSLDMSQIECKIGGDLGGYDTSAALERFRDDLGAEQYKKVRRLFRSATFSNRMSVLASLAAWQDAGLSGTRVDPFRTGVTVGGHNLNSNYIYENARLYLKDPELIDPLSGVEAIDPNVPATISEALGLQGPTFTVGGACASGNLALRLGFRDILLGECDRSLVVGGLFDVSPGDIQASVIIQAVVVKPEYQDRPEEASRPFDAGRCGFVYSHGTGTLVLEELEEARRRGARIYAEVLGVRANANANHLPQPAAETQGRLIGELLQATGVRPEEVDYVNCHATGTPVGDVEEIEAVKQAFGAQAARLKLNAPKSMLGHTCWAAPVVETIGGIMQMHGGRLHPTINIDRPDPQVDLDICAGGAVDHDVRLMVKNSFGFGGLNACSLIRRWEE